MLVLKILRVSDWSIILSELKYYIMAKAEGARLKRADTLATVSWFGPIGKQDYFALSKVEACHVTRCSLRLILLQLVSTIRNARYCTRDSGNIAPG